MRELVLGQSQNGRSIRAKTYLPVEISDSAGSSDAIPTLLCLAGTHADEVEGVWLIEALDAELSQNYPFSQFAVLTCAVLNPDGFELRTRHNARGVDLNRNLPTRDWTAEIKNPRYPPGPSAASEPETRALIELIEKVQPIAIFSAHSFSQYQINSNGPAFEWANQLAQVCGYPVTEDIGYPTPGSLGTYAGKERGIPTITLEIERGLSRERVLEIHLPTARAALEYWENKFTS